jgi:hypothetical protein
MRIALVVVAADPRNGTQLLRRQEAIGHGDAQHRRQALAVEAVLQAQGQELRLAELAPQVARGLVTELGDALLDDALVYGAVGVHVRPPPGCSAAATLANAVCAE